MNPEHPLLKKAKAEHPELFIKQPFVEGAAELAQFGIFIPHKESFPTGYIKLYPEDFIVEEIDIDGNIRTIDYENVLGPDSAVEGSGETIYATLVKCGLSTLEAIRDLSAKLGIDQKSVGYAGIKDRDAITSQRISIRGAGVEALKKASSPSYFLKDVSLGKGTMTMSSLKGNRFTIAVRTEGGAPLTTLQPGTESFYNYFYLQRFGSPRFINYQWGYDILKGDYEKAVKSVVFDPTGRDVAYMAQIRKQAFETRDWAKVREIFEPTRDMMYSETALVDHLIRHPDDFRGALNSIPEQVQLWLYGLASLLFNEKISAAVQQEMQPPASLPFIFSNEPADIEVYRKELTSLGIFPPPFQNLKTFPFMRLSHRTANTVEVATNISSAPLPEGSMVSFNLPKGAYATTFLSHHINIAADVIPETMSKDRIEPAALAGSPARIATIEKFRSLAPAAPSAE